MRTILPTASKPGNRRVAQAIGPGNVHDSPASGVLQPLYVDEGSQLKPTPQNRSTSHRMGAAFACMRTDKFTLELGQPNIIEHQVHRQKFLNRSADSSV